MPHGWGCCYCRLTLSCHFAAHQRRCVFPRGVVKGCKKGTETASVSLSCSKAGFSPLLQPLTFRSTRPRCTLQRLAVILHLQLSTCGRRCWPGRLRYPTDCSRTDHVCVTPWNRAGWVESLSPFDFKSLIKHSVRRQVYSLRCTFSSTGLSRRLQHRKFRLC